MTFDRKNIFKAHVRKDTLLTLAKNGREVMTDSYHGFKRLRIKVVPCRLNACLDMDILFESKLATGCKNTSNESKMHIKLACRL